MTSERMIQVPESTLRLWANRLKEGGEHGWEDHMATAMQEMLATQPAAGEPIQVETVAITREDDDGLYLDWVLEGGISALEAPGVVLLVAHGTVTDDQGSGEVYVAPPAAASVAAGEPVAEFFVEFATLRRAMSIYGLSAPESDHELGARMELYAIRVIEAVAKLPFPYPPAPAHADEPVQYRLLRLGEVILATDELLRDDCTTWQPMSDGPQLGIGREWHPGLVPMRRVEPAMRAQGDGEVE